MAGVKVGLGLLEAVKRVWTEAGAQMWMGHVFSGTWSWVEWGQQGGPGGQDG